MLKRTQRGSSLVEIMVSMALGFASITAMSSLVGHGVALNSHLMTKSRLHAEINAVMAVLSQDVARAGFHGATAQLVDSPSTFNNPFKASIGITQYGNETTNSCITFAYDRNNNGKLDVIDTNENYGYRLRDNAIEMRVDGLGCELGGWYDLTDTDMVKVNSLSFTQSLLENQGVQYFKVTIALQAELTRRSELSHFISSDVLIRNYD